MPYPCIVGWHQNATELGDVRRYHKASPLALSRWENDLWATGIRFYEDQAMAWNRESLIPSSLEQSAQQSARECSDSPTDGLTQVNGNRQKKHRMKDGMQRVTPLQYR